MTTSLDEVAHSENTPHHHRHRDGTNKPESNQSESKQQNKYTVDFKQNRNDFVSPILLPLFSLSRYGVVVVFSLYDIRACVAVAPTWPIG